MRVETVQVVPKETAAQTILATRPQLSLPPEVATVAPMVIYTQVVRYSAENSILLKQKAKEFLRKYSELKASAAERSRQADRMHAVISAELLRRTTEAQASLADAESKFQKPEAEFLEAKRAKEKVLSELAEHITSIESQLDAVGGDSDEQYYGKRLLQLLGSFRRNEVFSGDGKGPKSMDAKEVLLHVPKAQYSETSNGHEDFSNVRSVYFVGDFAFVNLPDRDVYSWSELRKMDKLIIEYLSGRVAYNATRQRLRETLQNSTVSETETREELESIARAEYDAHQSINRAQGLVDKCSSAAVVFNSKGSVPADRSDVLFEKMNEMRNLQEQSLMASYEEFVRREILGCVKTQTFGTPVSVVTVPDGTTINAHKNEFIVLYRDAGQGSGLRAHYLAELPAEEHTIALGENVSWDGELVSPDQSEAIATGATKVILQLSKEQPN